MLTAALNKKSGDIPSAFYCFNCICTANDAEKRASLEMITEDVTAEGSPRTSLFSPVNVLFELLN